MQVLRAHRVGLGAGLVAALVAGTLIRHAQRPHGALPSVSVQTPTSTEPAAPPEVSAATGSVATAATATATPSPAPAAPTPPPDLSGTWRGEYVDASGKQLLRVVSLSISRVHNDGGIEGTLQYEAASGDGECKLHPRGSSYSPGEQRLQLSPEGCSPHYPKELGVPLDFDGVNPQANVLSNGRIEAPTGAVIRVKLRRVS